MLDIPQLLQDFPCNAHNPCCPMSLLSDVTPRDVQTMECNANVVTGVSSARLASWQPILCCVAMTGPVQHSRKTTVARLELSIKMITFPSEMGMLCCCNHPSWSSKRPKTPE